LSDFRVPGLHIQIVSIDLDQPQSQPVSTFDRDILDLFLGREPW
jgi:hypothetical protein